MPSSHEWLLWAVLAAVFAALTAVLAKVGLEEMDADFAMLLRTVVILAALALFVTCARKWEPLGGLSRRAVVYLVLSGLATGASWVCYFRALQRGEASRVAPIDKLSVVLVALFAAAFLGERLSLREWAGVALVGAGAVLIAWRA
jgi:transporter family protein